MSRPGRFVCKLLVLFYLCAVAISKESSNETETTTAKADVGPSGEETIRVETIHHHGQDPEQKSYRYSEQGPGYLAQENDYNNQQHEDESYEYGKRVGSGEYKGASLNEYHQSALGYNHPQQEDHHSGYADSFKDYGQRQINGHDQTEEKGSSYKQLGNQDEYGQDDYGKKTAYEAGHSNGNKQGAYVQGFYDQGGQKIEYGYEIPKPQKQEYVAANGYDSKNYAEQANYGHDDSKALNPKGYDDESSYNAGSKSYVFPPKAPSHKTDYSSDTGAYSGKSLSNDNDYGTGAYSGGKSSSVDTAYGSDGHSGGKSSSADIAYGTGAFSGGKSSGNIAYGSGGYSDGKSSSGDIAYGTNTYSGGKSSGNIAYGSGGKSSGNIAYGSGGKSSGIIAYGSGGKSSGNIAYVSGGKSSGNIGYGSGGYSGGKSLSGDIAHGSGPYLGGKSSGNIAYVSGGYSSEKSGDASYGPGPYSGQKSSGNIAYVSGGYSGEKPSDISYESGPYSGGKSSGNIAYGTLDHGSGEKSSSGDYAHGSGLYSGGKSSGSIAFAPVGYSGEKSSGNAAYGSTGHSSAEIISPKGVAYGSGAYSSGAYAPDEKYSSGEIGYQSGANVYTPVSKSEGSAYSSGGKSSHFPNYPKEAGYISGGSKEPIYLHAVGNGGSDVQKEAGYYQGTPSKGEDLSSILHQGQSSKGSNHGKVSVFIKQLGHSDIGNKYGSQTGERHGYLLLPVVPGKEGDKIKIATTGSYAGSGYKSSGGDDSGLSYAHSPIHATNGKSSFTSFFKAGGSEYESGSNSAYKSGGNYGAGGESYGTDSKSGGDYSNGGNGGQKLTLVGQNAYAVSGHPSYESHSENPKGTPYSKEYTQQHSQGYDGHQGDYQEGGHGILSQNVKYIPAHEYQKQLSYAGHDTSSYGKSVQPQTHIGKGTAYVKESSGYQLQGSHASSPKGYDQGKFEQTSYGGHISGPVAIPDNVKYISQTHDYGKQQSYGGHDGASYGSSGSHKQSNGKGTDFQPTNYKFSTPNINPHAGVASSYNQKQINPQSYGSSSGHQQSPGGYIQPKSNASHKKPKSIALILQRHQGGSEGYKPPIFPAKGQATNKSVYSATGFQPIFPKYGGRSTSLHYNVKSSQASPSYASIDHTKGAGRYY